MFKKKNVSDILDENQIIIFHSMKCIVVQKLMLSYKTQKVNSKKKEFHDFKLRTLSFYIELYKQIKTQFNFNSPHLIFQLILLYRMR